MVGILKKIIKPVSKDQISHSYGFRRRTGQNVQRNGKTLKGQVKPLTGQNVQRNGKTLKGQVNPLTGQNVQRNGKTLKGQVKP